MANPNRLLLVLTLLVIPLPATVASAGKTTDGAICASEEGMRQMQTALVAQDMLAVQFLVNTDACGRMAPNIHATIIRPSKIVRGACLVRLYGTNGYNADIWTMCEFIRPDAPPDL